MPLTPAGSLDKNRLAEGAPLCIEKEGVMRLVVFIIVFVLGAFALSELNPEWTYLDGLVYMSIMTVIVVPIGTLIAHFLRGDNR